jgi:hypothetical protein
VLRGFLSRAYTGNDSVAAFERGTTLSVRFFACGRQTKGSGLTRVEEVKQFPAIDRRRSVAVPYEQREAGEVAVFQELGKALTSSLQLDQVLRTIMEKIDEFLRPENWSLLLLDEAKQELYFELAVGKA